MKLLTHLGVCAVGLLGAAATPDGAVQTLDVRESGAAPDLRVSITAPGVYKAAVRQSYGGGISEFYNLAADPEAKVNVAGRNAGLFEIGWHGASWKRPEGADPKTCCVNHSLGEDPSKNCHDGARFWPWENLRERQIEGSLQVIERSGVRVRVRTDCWFAAGNGPLRADKDLPVTGIYTFYPSGEIFIQVRVRRSGTLPMHWNFEFGPHLFVAADNKNPAADPHFVWSAPNFGMIEDEKAPVKPESLMLALSEKTRTSLMLTITPEEHALFPRSMRHNGRSVNWDRAGYGSHSLVMQPGYDQTWACRILLGTPSDKLLPELKTADDALAYAMDYREPGIVSGATLVRDDPGDFNKDGFNESEGCFVLRGPGPLALDYEKNGAGYAPCFKVLGWKGETAKVSLEDADVPLTSAVVNGTLLVKLFGTVSPKKVRIRIGQ